MRSVSAWSKCILVIAVSAEVINLYWTAHASNPSPEPATQKQA